MDQKRLMVAIAISIGILLVFDLLSRPYREQQKAQQQQQQQQQQAQVKPQAAQATAGAAGSAATAESTALATPAARLPIEAQRVKGSFSLRGARLDDLVLKDYRETVDPKSPLVRLLAPREDAAPYYAQWGWTAPDGRTRVPDGNTDWAATGGPLAPGTPVTLGWDNGQGQRFEIGLTVDDNYMFSVEQRVTNRGASCSGGCLRTSPVRSKAARGSSSRCPACCLPAISRESPEGPTVRCSRGSAMSRARAPPPRC